MIANFQSMPGREQPQHELDEHADWLGRNINWVMPGNINQGHKPPEGYENYYCVDVIGKEFVWMNNTFTKDKYNWYIWFESVFLVPPEMASFLALRWPVRDPNDPIIINVIQ